MTPTTGLVTPTLTGAARHGLCTDCGVSRMGDGKACERACQFFQPDGPALEPRMPDGRRPIMSFRQPRIGPRGLECARARVAMKAVETVLHLRRADPARMKNMIPALVWRLVARSGLTLGPDESRDP
jgi:hypothetical protein